MKQLFVLTTSQARHDTPKAQASPTLASKQFLAGEAKTKRHEAPETVDNNMLLTADQRTLSPYKLSPAGHSGAPSSKPFCIVCKLGLS